MIEMKWIEKARKITGLTNYGLSKTLRKEGVEVTTQGIDGYFKKQSKSMRLDVLCGLRKLSGVSWAEFGKWLDNDYLK